MAINFSVGNYIVVNQDHVYTDSGTYAVPNPVAFEFSNTGPDDVDLAAAGAGSFTIEPETPDDWNLVPNLPSTIFSFVSASYIVSAGSTASFYLNNSTPRRIYVRESDSQPLQNFADAIAAGPV